MAVPFIVETRTSLRDMINDAGLDEDKIICGYSKLLNEQKSKTAQASTKDAVRSKLKEERAQLVNHFYIVMNITRDKNYSCINHPTRSCVSDLLDESDHWLDCFDYDVQYRGRKFINFNLAKPKRYNTKPRKQKLEEISSGKPTNQRKR